MYAKQYKREKEELQRKIDNLEFVISKLPKKPSWIKKIVGFWCIPVVSGSVSIFVNPNVGAVISFVGMVIVFVYCIKHFAWHKAYNKLQNEKTAIEVKRDDKADKAKIMQEMVEIIENRIGRKNL